MKNKNKTCVLPVFASWQAWTGLSAAGGNEGKHSYEAQKAMHTAPF